MNFVMLEREREGERDNDKISKVVFSRCLV